MSFSGRFLNMANVEWWEHQYRVYTKVLYTNQLSVWICMWVLCATLIVPLHLTSTYSYYQFCHTPPSSFTVCHSTPLAHTLTWILYEGNNNYWSVCKVRERRIFLHVMFNVLVNQGLSRSHTALLTSLTPSVRCLLPATKHDFVADTKCGNKETGFML